MGFENCHPAVNALFFCAVLYGSATFTHPAFLAVGYVCGFLYSVKRSRGKGWLGNLCLLPLAVAFALYYASYHHFGVTVLRQNMIGNNLTVESLVSGLLLGLRGAAVCMWLRCLFSVMTSDKVVYLLGRLSPMLSLGLTILLRLAPRMGQEAVRIHRSRAGIGRGIAQGNVWQRMKNALAIVSALLTWMIQALALEADSMRGRGSLLPGRSAFSIYRFDNRDRALVVGMFAAMTLTAMGVLLGATELICAPRILWNRPTAWEGVTLAGYGALCLLPLILDLGTEWVFRRAREK